eukprot:gene10047-2219_t
MTSTMAKNAIQRVAPALGTLRQKAMTHTTVLPPIVNEPIKEYPPGSIERENLLAACQHVRTNIVDIPCVLNGKEVFTGDIVEQRA